MTMHYRQLLPLNIVCIFRLVRGVVVICWPRFLMRKNQQNDAVFCFYYSPDLLLSSKAAGYWNYICDTANHNKFKRFNFYFEPIHCCIHFAIPDNTAIIQLH